MDGNGKVLCRDLLLLLFSFSFSFCFFFVVFSFFVCGDPGPGCGQREPHQLLPGIARDMRQLYIHSFCTRANLPATAPKLPDDSRFYVNFAYMTLFHLSSAQHRITLIDLRNVIASSKCLGSSMRPLLRENCKL